MSALPVIHLSRQLLHPPTVDAVPGVTVRTFAGEQDVDIWLELRTRAFAGEKPAVRPWTRADFATEFLDKPWWSPERMWFAETERVIGSVGLALRGRGPAAVPVVHWLMVLPECRRLGIGRLLVSTAEAFCWQTGDRDISLETHAGWSAALAFYRAMGYR